MKNNPTLKDFWVVFTEDGYGPGYVEDENLYPTKEAAQAAIPQGSEIQSAQLLSEVLAVLNDKTGLEFILARIFHIISLRAKPIKIFITPDKLILVFKSQSNH